MPRIVSITSTIGLGAPVDGIYPGSVGGTGSGAPVDGIYPAIAELERTHASAIANAKRFIVGSPFKV